jgi:hypothetical protein
LRPRGSVTGGEPASLLPVLPPYVVAPSTLGDGGNGRWIRESSSLTLGHDFRRPLHTVRTGYAKYVGLYQGEDDEMLERIYGQAPAFLLEWVRNDLESVGMRHGSLYEFDLSFVVHCLSRNLRDGADALVGSDVPADSGTAPAPGLARMLGDVQYLLAGSRLGLEPGVKHASIDGSAQIVETDLAQRWFRAELPLTVRASVHLIDEDLFEDPEVWIARKDAGTAGQEPIDLSNYVAEGLRFVSAPGLTGTPLTRGRVRRGPARNKHASAPHVPGQLGLVPGSPTGWEPGLPVRSERLRSPSGHSGGDADWGHRYGPEQDHRGSVPV